MIYNYIGCQLSFDKNKTIINQNARDKKFSIIMKKIFNIKTLIFCLDFIFKLFGFQLVYFSNYFYTHYNKQF